jgi:hypothetical protein
MSTVEDAVNAHLLVDAFNHNLHLSGIDQQFTIAGLRKRNRATQLNAWLASHGLPRLKKVDLAQRVLDIASDRTMPVVYEIRVPAILRLHQSIEAGLLAAKDS